MNPSSKRFAVIICSLAVIGGVFLVMLVATIRRDETLRLNQRHGDRVIFDKSQSGTVAIDLQSGVIEPTTKSSDGIPSPNGRWLIEPHRGLGYLIDVRAKTRKHIPGSSFVYDVPGWFPDGSRIVFAAIDGREDSNRFTESIRRGLGIKTPSSRSVVKRRIPRTGWDVYVLNVPTMKLTPIVKTEQDEWLSILRSGDNLGLSVVHSDNEHLLFVQGNRFYGMGAISSRTRLIAYSMKAKNSHLLYDSGREAILEHAISPDGSLVAVSLYGKLRLIRYPSGTIERDIAFDSVDSRLQYHWASFIVWSPDSRSIACRVEFLGGRMMGTSIYGDNELFVFDVKSGKAKTFHPGRGIPRMIE